MQIQWLKNMIKSKFYTWHCACEHKIVIVKSRDEMENKVMYTMTSMLIITNDYCLHAEPEFVSIIYKNTLVGC